MRDARDQALYVGRGRRPAAAHDVLLPRRRHAAAGRARAARRRAARVPRGRLVVRGPARRDPPHRRRSGPARTARARGPTGWPSCGSSASGCRGSSPPARSGSTARSTPGRSASAGRPTTSPGRCAWPTGCARAAPPARSRRDASRDASAAASLPAAAPAERAAHDAAAAALAAALEGGGVPIGRLRARRATLAADQRFEEAARLRDDEAALRSAGAELRRVRAARSLHGVVLCAHRDPRLVAAFAVAYGLVVEQRPLPRSGEAHLEVSALADGGRARRPRRARAGGAARRPGRPPRRGAARGRRVRAAGELARRGRRRRRTASWGPSARRAERV